MSRTLDREAHIQRERGHAPPDGATAPAAPPQSAPVPPPAALRAAPPPPRPDPIATTAPPPSRLSLPSIALPISVALLGIICLIALARRPAPPVREVSAEPPSTLRAAPRHSGPPPQPRTAPDDQSSARPYPPVAREQAITDTLRVLELMEETARRAAGRLEGLEPAGAGAS